MMSIRALALLIALGVVPALAAGGDLAAPSASAGSQVAPPPLGAADRVAAALEDPVLRELVRDTLERNPGLATAIAVARASLQAAPQAQALPDPVIGVTGYLSSPETRVGPQRLVATLSQRLLLEYLQLLGCVWDGVDVCQGTPRETPNIAQTETPSEQ